MPATTPLYYRVATQALTQAVRLTVLRADSFGAVEPVVVAMADGLWIWSDRKAESLGYRSVEADQRQAGRPTTLVLRG